MKKQRQEEQGKEEVDMADVLGDFARKARDHARVPMQVRITRIKWGLNPLRPSPVVEFQPSCWLYNRKAVDESQR